MVANKAEGAPVSETNWPDAAPHPEVDVIVSIVCGNSHYLWAIHESPKQDFYPSLFWRTSPVPADDFTKDPCEVIQRYLPQSGQDFFFGTHHGAMTSQVAFHHAASKRIPVIPVYLVSSNPKHEAGIQFLLRDMPVDIFRMKGTHFFSPEQGAYPGMGVDRLAAAKAAIGLTGVPALVIDGGTAMSYTAVGVDGMIEGGGISPGLQVKLSSLGDYTGETLPSLTHQDITDAIEECNQERKPLPLFARTTKKAILGSVLSETAQHVSGIVKGWIAHARPQLATANPNEGGPKLNTEFTVIVSGGDGNTIKTLLEQQSKIIRQVHDPPKGYSLLFQKHIVHQGIQRIFCENLVLPESKAPEEQLRDSILGQRVAKNFQRQRGGSVLYRGTVASVDRSKSSLDNDFYTVLYDDAEREAVGVAELYDMLLVYAAKGEKASERDSYKRKQFDQKTEQAKRAAGKLAEHCDKVKKIVAKRNMEKQAAAVAAAPTSSGSKRPVPDPKTTAAPAPNKRPKPTAVPATAAAPPAADNSTAKAAAPKPPAATEKKTSIPATAPSPAPSKASTTAATKPSSKKEKKPALNLEGDPESVVGCRMCKFFENNELYFGTISSFFNAEETDDKIDLWNITYDDGDLEDFEIGEVKMALEHYAVHKHEDPKFDGQT